MSTSGNRLDLAVFPLFNAVLFPGTTLPLQIFEERYLQMMKDIQARGWPLAVALVVGERGDELRLSSICGAGEVQFRGEIRDGKTEVLVHGTQRVRLLNVIQQQPYLIMEAEQLQTDGLVGPLAKNGFEEFLGLVKTWAFMNSELPDEMTLVFDQFTTFSSLTDFFVFHFLKNIKDKQEYLNCANPIKRAEMLAAFLETDLIRLSKRVKRRKKTSLLH